MENKTVTIRQAIMEGKRKITLPGNIIAACTFVAFIGLLLIHASWMDFLILIIGFIIRKIYLSAAVPDWRIWAYDHIADIHQLQRSAELAGLLPIQSGLKYTGMVSGSQIQELAEHYKRFSEPEQFVDDPSVPEELKLKSDLDNIQSLVLNSAGIVVDYDSFLGWDDIYNDRIVPVGTKSTSPIYGTFNSTNLHFRFECPLGRLEIPMSSLNISPWELDLMLYVYRGRYEKGERLNDQAAG